MKSFVGIGISVFAVLGGCTAGPPPAPTETKLAARAAPPPVAPAAARSFRFVAHREPPSPAESPVSLTASDGTGLRLTSLRARAVVDDPLAFTELHLEFRNPEDRVIEGQFRITLPEGASLSRFAMIIDGRTQEGEVVELQAARRAYEDALHRRQDPALLEQAAGNEFSARVFPIPPRATKHLIVSYSQELRGPYRLPLRGLPELGELDIDVQRPGLPATHEASRGVVPRADFVLPGDRTSRGGRQGLRAGDLVVARIAPLAETAPDEIDSLVVLFDSSASRALGYREQVTLLADLIAGLAAGDARDEPLLVAAFDQDVQPIYEGTPAGFGAAEKERLLARGALGASDLGRAVRWAAEHAGGRKRVLLVSDGVATAGELKDAARSLAAAGVQRLDALAVGGIRDEAALRALTATLPRPGAVIDGRLDVSAIAARLTRGARAGLAVKVEGAEWWFPRTLDGVQAGDEVLVYASLPPGPMRVTAGERTIDVPAQALAPAERPLLERAAAKARIDDLVAQKQRADAKQAEALRRQITELSIRQRVISPYTALLVLETEEDYARFAIDRRALADILTVGQQGLAVVDRGSAAATTVAKRGKRRPGPEREAEEGESPPPKETVAAEDKAEKKDVAKTKSADSAGELFMDAKPSPAPTTPAPPPPPPAELSARDDDNDREEERVNPYTGPFREIMSLIAKKRAAEALARARAWRGEDPSDIMALIALGEALEASRDQETAARAYGSLIDLFPGRADLRRFAGQRLERLTLRAARELAVDTYAHAVEQRPDHPASHRLYAFALERSGAHAQAFAALAAGLARDYPDGRFAGAKEILAEDLGLIAASWMRAEPSRRKEIRARLQAAGGHVEDAPSLRFVLVWETDANDVDFHIHDGLGGHAYYSQRELPSGGRLYEDVTTGYGPECFTIRAPRAERAYPYKLQAHYYSRGPMGYGMGKLQIIEHDGAGNLRFEERPFVVMQDGAFVDLGSVRQRS